MPSLPELTAHLLARRDLSPADVAAAAAALVGAEASPEAKGDFLTALAAKGETADEVTSFAREFRARAVDPGVGEWADRAVDIVGTGGDLAGGFNVSSLVALVLASAGVPVMKHGNRGITSRCGSADLLGALGVNIEAPAATAPDALRELGFAFFFAPAYHPAFRNIGPVRKALAARGQRTIFNILGPLLNPGRPAFVVLGSFSDAWLPRLAGALEALGTRAGIAAHGTLGPGKGIDELTTAGANRVLGFGRLRGFEARWRAEDFGLRTAPVEDLMGGEVADNLALTEALVGGRGPAGLADTIALNAAVAMWVAGRTAEVRDGLEESAELLRGGAVRRKIAAVREFYQRR